MNQKKFLIIVLLCLVFGVILASWLAGRQISDAEGEGGSTKTGAPDVTGEAVTFTVTEGERKKWEMRVTRAFYFEDQSGADLEGVEGEFFNAEGESVAKFSAPKGKYLNLNKAVMLSDGVTIVSTGSDKESTLKAPTLTWSTRSDKAVAEGGVTLEMGGFADANASRCEFSLDMSDLKLQGGVESRIDL